VGAAIEQCAKKVEMRFAHLKVRHGFGRMRLRGLTGACDEFHLAAIVQNLKTMALRRVVLMGRQKASVSQAPGDQEAAPDGRVVGRSKGNAELGSGWRELFKLVIGNYVGADFRLAHVRQTDGRDVSETEPACGSEPAHAGGSMMLLLSTMIGFVNPNAGLSCDLTS
jgi:hypothetical protein